MAQETHQPPHQLRDHVIKNLVGNYGTAHTEILKYISSDPSAALPVTAEAAILKAEVLYNVRDEMALKLADVIRRRTELGSAGYPGDAAVQASAALMATELGWNAEKTQQEIRDVQAVYKTVN